MASCKDCVHADMCKYKDLPAPLSDSYIRESECIEKRCGDFKDRSRFVKLPCNLGDELCEIGRDYKIRKWIVTDISFSAYSSFNKTVIAAREKNGSKHLRFSERFLGKTVFLTIEEAEQALKGT